MESCNENENIPSSSSSSQPNFRFLESSHGGRILVKSGRRHYLKRNNEKSCTSVWTCDKIGVCSGLLVLDPKERQIIRETEHTCIPDYQSIDIEESIIKLKHQVTKDYRPIPQLYKEEMRQYMHEEYVDKLPSFYKKKDMLSNARRNVESFEYGDNVIIPENIVQDWLCVKDNDIIIFITSQAKEWIQNCTTYFSDGTFRVVPNPYTQLYTFHVDIGSSSELTKVVPCIYALLPNKLQDTYTRMLNCIKNHIPNFQPKMFKVDFESGVINAIKDIYPSAEIKGCFFHYSQAIYKNGEKLGITNSREGTNYLAKCVSLAHFPPLKIHEAWLTVLSESPNIAQIDQFNKYMQSQWIKVEMIYILSCFDARHRTNNVTESWHKKINNILKKKSNLLLCISELKAEAEVVNFTILQNQVRPDVFRRRNKKYVVRDTKIKQILHNYLEGINDMKKTVALLSYLKY